MERIEELVNDPGNHAVLKELATREEEELQELAQVTGLTEERLKDKTQRLEEENLITAERKQVPTVLRIHRENLNDLRDEIKGFHEDRHEQIEGKLQEEEKTLEDARQQLEEKKDDTSSLKKEKKFERQIETLESAIEACRQAETSEELLGAYSLSHRVLRFTDFREEDFHGFNPWRKLKASRKLDEVLEQRPEEEETRRFFGNRWVKESRIE